jgi:hypothetical protein
MALALRRPARVPAVTELITRLTDDDIETVPSGGLDISMADPDASDEGDSTDATDQPSDSDTVDSPDGDEDSTDSGDVDASDS